MEGNPYDHKGRKEGDRKNEEAQNPDFGLVFEIEKCQDERPREKGEGLPQGKEGDMALEAEPYKDREGLEEDSANASSQRCPRNPGDPRKKDFCEIKQKGSQIEPARHFHEKDFERGDRHDPDPLTGRPP